MAEALRAPASIHLRGGRSPLRRVCASHAEDSFRCIACGCVPPVRGGWLAPAIHGDHELRLVMERPPCPAADRPRSAPTLPPAPVARGGHRAPCRRHARSRQYLLLPWGRWQFPCSGDLLRSDQCLELLYLIVAQCLRLELRHSAPPPG